MSKHVCVCVCDCGGGETLNHGGQKKDKGMGMRPIATRPWTTTHVASVRAASAQPTHALVGWLVALHETTVSWTLDTAFW